MNFDTVIIGGGLAGLTCAIHLQQQGQRCAIINNGQAAMDFSSGSMDLISELPNGEIVQSFSHAFEALKAQAPEHPYSLIGQQKVLEKAKMFEEFARSLNLGLEGSVEKNHLRVSPLGGLRRTWLSPNSVPAMPDNQTVFPYKSIAILGIEGYHDFQPQLLTDNLKQNPEFAECEIRFHYLHIPALDQLRTNAREFRSVNIAQLLEHKMAFRDLVKEIQQAANGAEAVFLPACFGLDSQAFFESLKQATGLALFELPTLPPSLLGIRQRKQLRERFEKLGGLMMNGDRALRAEYENGRVKALFTEIHQEIAITAQNFVLASGGFFSNGLIAEFDEIYEPIFRADIQGCKTFSKTDRLTWTTPRFSSPQPYQSAGVIINERCQVRRQGEFMQNLYATGHIIGGYNGIELGCGSGVAIVTALVVAEQIGGQK